MIEVDGNTHFPYCRKAQAELKKKQLANCQPAKKRKATDELKAPKAKRQTTYNMGGVNFTSLKKLADYVKGLLTKGKAEWAHGNREFHIVSDVLRRVDSNKEIKWVVVGVQPGENGKPGSFYYKLAVEAAAIPIQHRECLKGTPVAVKSEAIHTIAFRNAIKPAWTKTRNNFFRIPGNVPNVLRGGTTFTKRNSEVVYKTLSFEKILEQFLKAENLKIPDLQSRIVGANGNPNRVSVGDPDLKSRWIDFHEKKAELEVVPKQKAPKPTVSSSDSSSSSSSSSSVIAEEQVPPPPVAVKEKPKRKPRAKPAKTKATPVVAPKPLPPAPTATPKPIPKKAVGAATVKTPLQLPVFAVKGKAESAFASSMQEFAEAQELNPVEEPVEEEQDEEKEAEQEEEEADEEEEEFSVKEM